MRCVTDGILCAVGRQCPQLDTLKVLKEWRATHRGLKGLCRSTSTSLRVLAVPHDDGLFEERSISARDAAFLLSSLPNLRRLDCAGSTLGAALTLGTSDTRLEVLSVKHTTQHELQAILKRCQAVEELELWEPKVGVVAGVAGLSRLSKLFVVNLRCRELMQLLESAGPRLTELEIEDCDTELVNLALISALCPRLEKFSISDFDGEVTGPCKWPALRYIFLPRLPRQRIFELVQGAPLLQTLAVGTTGDLLDEDVPVLCSSCPELEKVKLFGYDWGWGEFRVRLTRNAVLTFLESCRKLRILGDLTTWDLSREEFMALQQHIDRSNLDVTLD